MMAVVGPLARDWGHVKQAPAPQVVARPITWSNRDWDLEEHNKAHEHNEGEHRD